MPTVVSRGRKESRLDDPQVHVAISAVMKRKRRAKRAPKPRSGSGSVAESAGKKLTSYNVGVLPILNRIIKRAKLEEFLREFMLEDKRCKISPVIGTLVLLRNYLVSREPIYGVGEWARQYVPKLLGLSSRQVASLNDDGAGRSLNRLFDADCPSLVLAITRHVVEEFGLDLSEIHNDSTTITFSGAYEDARSEKKVRGRKTPAITWGHNKDHRPDLKQLLYNLVVSSDGAVPVAFGVESGNVTDDTTHRATWDFLCQIVGGPDFIYVADSKLATHANMSHIANRSGRFISVLPRTRNEDKVFRGKLVRREVVWTEIDRKCDENDQAKVVDTLSVSSEPVLTNEGFRLLWFHSTRKVELDRAARANKVSRAIGELSGLRLRMHSPRTRYREKQQVEKAIKKLLAETKASKYILVEIRPEVRTIDVQTTPGRPGPNTQYRKEKQQRFDIVFTTNDDAIEEAEKQDGVFPLVTNDRKLSAKEVLQTYKRQSQIEKRFSQLKTQFQVAPVFLKSTQRIVALLTVYYLALLVQALLERELRLGMKADRIDSIPLYPEERNCKAPATRRIIDFFANIQRHELRSPGKRSPVTFSTELSDLQREILRLLRVPVGDYEA